MNSARLYEKMDFDAGDWEQKAKMGLQTIEELKKQIATKQCTTKEKILEILFVVTGGRAENIKAAEQISELCTHDEETKMNEEISSECIGLFSKQYDSEETGIHFKQRMGFLSDKYSDFNPAKTKN